MFSRYKDLTQTSNQQSSDFEYDYVSSVFIVKPDV